MTNTNEPSVATWASVTCPVCGASPDKDCVRRPGFAWNLLFVHPERRALADKKNEEQA